MQKAGGSRKLAVNQSNKKLEDSRKLVGCRKLAGSGKLVDRRKPAGCRKLQHELQTRRSLKTAGNCR